MKNKCSIDGCEKTVRGGNIPVCNMHYTRHYRTGSYDLKPSKRAQRIENAAGYESIYKPGHMLSDGRGYVYEHRYIYFEKVDRSPSSCGICGERISWDNCHIDHIDNDIKNNNKKNLRALCRPCNVYRDRPINSQNKHLFTVDGVTMGAHMWSRRDDVMVSGNTILRRRRMGMSDYDCIYAPRLTHKNTTTRNEHGKYDQLRMVASK